MLNKQPNWYPQKLPAYPSACASAQLALGVTYDKGSGVPKDFEQAVNWYRKAAEHRSVFSTCEGSRTRASHTTSAEANQKRFYPSNAPRSTKAFLTRRSLRPVQPRRDVRKRRRYSQRLYSSVNWFRKAADQAELCMPAQIIGGLLRYENGDSVPKGDVLAYMWCNLLAAAQGNYR